MNNYYLVNNNTIYVNIINEKKYLPSSNIYIYFDDVFGKNLHSVGACWCDSLFKTIHQSH